MEKLWLRIWIQREKLRYKHNKPFMCQILLPSELADDDVHDDDNNETMMFMTMMIMRC